MAKIDVGRLTAEETSALFVELTQNLTEEQLFEALEQVLTKEQKQELGESWFNIDRE